MNDRSVSDKPQRQPMTPERYELALKLLNEAIDLFGEEPGCDDVGSDPWAWKINAGDLANERCPYPIDNDDGSQKQCNANGHCGCIFKDEPATPSSTAAPVAWILVDAKGQREPAARTWHADGGFDPNTHPHGIEWRDKIAPFGEGAKRGPFKWFPLFASAASATDAIDAKRYRWLRNHPHNQFTPKEEKEWWPSVWMNEDATYPLQASFLDQALDAAMRRSDGRNAKEKA